MEGTEAYKDHERWMRSFALFVNVQLGNYNIDWRNHRDTLVTVSTVPTGHTQHLSPTELRDKQHLVDSEPGPEA